MRPPALLALRLLALTGLLLSLWALLANLAQSYDTFNPSYAAYYWKQQLLRPTLGLALSLLVLLLARPLSRWISRE
ncbi:hypothetical protein [Geminisphaera colitermitum]|uniref:hypothetical protein n=1 Tax=Geminisphaera colitermitum TaxID=1148786 RepID=UPI000158DD13|nr:hypothetical protein [Geminisphaera colitermitum]